MNQFYPIIKTTLLLSLLLSSFIYPNFSVAQSSSEDIDVIYEICIGDTLRLNSISRAINCGDISFTRWSEWAPDPSLSVLDDPSFVLINPEETTIYSTTLGGFECPEDGLEFSQGPTYTFEVIVNTAPDCILANAINTTSFDFVGCIGDTLTLPRPNAGTCDGGETPDGAGILFDIIGATQRTLEIVLIESGVTTYSTNIATDAEGISCPQATYIYNLEATDCGGEVEEPTDEIDVFGIYPWLTTLIDRTDCNGALVEVFDLGNFAFVLISTKESEVLYFEDGTRYCTSSTTLDCQSFYGLTIPTTTWICGEEDADGEENTDEEEAEEEETEEENSPPTNTTIFDDFPWLNSLIDTNACQGEQVLVYEKNGFFFLFIETIDGATLYFQTGDIYCFDAPNNDCRALYGLENLVETYICSANFSSNNGRNSNKHIIEKNERPPSFNIFPNPSHGLINIAIEGLSSNEATLVTIFDINGKLLKQTPINTATNTSIARVNLMDLQKGMYFIEIKTTSGYSKVTRVAIQ